MGNNDHRDTDDNETTDVINWSGTHKVTVANANFWEPESISEVEAIVQACHARGQTVRPLGSSLSPNGIALNEKGMISMANVDRVLEIDTKNSTITVEAGIPVSKVRTITTMKPFFSFDLSVDELYSWLTNPEPCFQCFIFSL